MSQFTKTVKRLKRLAPKVPDYTCPDIDFIIDKIEHNNKPFTQARKRTLIRKLERLRKQNEDIRELGKFLYRKFKDYLVEYMD